MKFLVFALICSVAMNTKTHTDPRVTQHQVCKNISHGYLAQQIQSLCQILFEMLKKNYRTVFLTQVFFSLSFCYDLDQAQKVVSHL